MELTNETPVVSLSAYMPLPDRERQYRSDFIESHSAIILAEDTTSVTIGVCNTNDKVLQEILSHFHDKDIIYKHIEYDELSEYLGKRNAGFSDKTFSSSPKKEKLLLDKIANDAPVINFVNSTIIEAIRKRASDIHIEAFSETVKVRYRIDGVLRTHNSIDPALFPAVSSRLKIMANLNIMEKRLPQDGRTSVFLGGYNQDIRVSIVPTVRGESIVLRLLNRKSARPGLDRLGLNRKSLHDMRKIVKIPSGLVLVTGPTGSGKTTTLNSMLKEMDYESLKIITVEDPIEYVIEGIDQIQTNETIGLTFNSILRRILRQDPNVIMIGEIRDRETAVLSIRAALTGHLVLSTLHTNDSVSVINRLKDMGVEPFMISAVLKVSMAQRLVRKLCPHCRKKRPIDTIETKAFKQSKRSPDYLYEAVGCSRCDGTGYRGRTIIHEYFFCDEKMERMIAGNTGDEEIRNVLRTRGMMTLWENGLEKVEKGLTTLTELETVLAVR